MKLFPVKSLIVLVLNWKDFVFKCSDFVITKDFIYIFVEANLKY